MRRLGRETATATKALEEDIRAQEKVGQKLPVYADGLTVECTRTPPPSPES